MDATEIVGNVDETTKLAAIGDLAMKSAEMNEP